MTFWLDVKKYTVKDLMGQQNLTIKELAQRSGLSVGVINRALRPSRHKTNITCANAIAAALGVTVNDIDWINGTSDVGRSAHTGSPLLKHRTPESTAVCPIHFTTLPISGVCDDCM